MFSSIKFWLESLLCKNPKPYGSTFWWGCIIGIAAGMDFPVVAVAAFVALILFGKRNGGALFGTIACMVLLSVTASNSVIWIISGVGIVAVLIGSIADSCGGGKRALALKLDMNISPKIEVTLHATVGLQTIQLTPTIYINTDGSANLVDEDDEVVRRISPGTVRAIHPVLRNAYVVKNTDGEVF